MKAGIHPDYKDAVFIDTSTGHKFLSRTTMTSKEMVKWEDGKEYPLIRVDISALLAPLFHREDEIRRRRWTGREVPEKIQVGASEDAEGEAAP